LLLLLLDSFYGESSPPLTKTMWVEALIWNIGEFGQKPLQTINQDNLAVLFGVPPPKNQLGTQETGL
jgi:hypothetical protein